MEDASVLPGVWAKGLLYRPTNLTNVFVTDGFDACTTTSRMGTSTEVAVRRVERPLRKVGEGNGGRWSAA